MSRARPAVVRFYFDADVLGLAHVVAGLRSDATMRRTLAVANTLAARVPLAPED